jgi:FKBP-type peptidyl-prolyl cis-trans isomerase FkpA
MRRIIYSVVLLLLATPLLAAELPQSDDQKTLYAVGMSLARSLFVFNLSPAELAVVQQGMADVFSGKNVDLDVATYNAKIMELAKARRKVRGEMQAGAGKAYLEKAASEKGAVKTDSGMVYLSLAEGKGESPKASDVVKVNYRGTLIDGTEFDSTYKRGKPLEFKLSNVISCWVEGVQKMKPGGKSRLVCPSNLAYGENGSGELILPGATLAFEVELLDIVPPLPTSLPPSSPAPQTILPAQQQSSDTKK